jgi:hypothetical protein
MDQRNEIRHRVLVEGEAPELQAGVTTMVSLSRNLIRRFLL